MQWDGVDRVIVTEPLCDVIGTHAARRTFVVHALEEGMSPQIVMTFTGHEDYDSLKPYIAITDKTRKNLRTTLPLSLLPKMSNLLWLKRANQ